MPPAADLSPAARGLGTHLQSIKLTCNERLGHWAPRGPASRPAALALITEEQCSRWTAGQGHGGEHSVGVEPSSRGSKLGSPAAGPYKDTRHFLRVCCV